MVVSFVARDSCDCLLEVDMQRVDWRLEVSDMRESQIAHDLGMNAQKHVIVDVISH